MNIGPAWTDTQVSELRRLWPDYSASQCARMLGVTRNAVIGKVHRLNGYRPMPKNKRVEAIQARPMPQQNPKITPAQRMVVQRGKNNTYSDPVELVDMPEITDLPPDESDFACTIVDLEFGMCRFPIGTPQDLATFRYCGAEADGPWCQRHRRVVYIRPGGR